MASGWVKSLQCKSISIDKDVINPNPKNHLMSCRKTSQTIRDVVHTATTTTKPHKPKHHRPNQPKPSPDHSNQTLSKPKTEPALPSASRSRSARSSDSLLPALTEISEGHPSRNVVEIIFHTSWSNKSFPGRIEMIFKVHNGSRTVTRFEDYREMVKTRAGFSGGTTWEENARCVADGNEMMRFYCLGPTGGVHDTRGGSWVFPGVKGASICTFSGSGAAHDNAGGGSGRRAMLVCRVIAGRVSKQIEFESLIDGRVEFDSVSGASGELLVFDPRAVLPCFLIIYKL